MSAVPPDTRDERVRGDRYIRTSAITVVVVLAAVAMFVSYRHQYELAVGYGEPAETARLFPITIDGVIIMASLILLYCARLRLPVPPLARGALWAGIAATLAANAAHGWSGGLGSRLVSAAPAAVLVIAYELLMWLIRTMKTTTPQEAVERVVYRDVPVEVPVEVEVPVLPADRFEAARLVVEDAHNAGRRLPGRRALADRWGIEIREAVEILDGVAQKPDQAEPPAPPAEPPAAAPRAVGPEPTNDELTAGMTPAEELAGPGISVLRRQWRENAASVSGSANGSAPSGGEA